MLQKTSVLVTAVGGRAFGYQILECLKSLGDKYRIITTDMDPFAPGLYESDASYLLPPSANEKKYIQKLLSVAKKEGVKIILPGHESEVKVISRYKKKFLDEGIIPVVSEASVIENSLDKLNLWKFLTKNNILTPKTVLLNTPDQAVSLTFPIVIKPTKNSSGSRNCYIIKDINELRVIFNDLQKDEKIELLAQEYVGSENEEYTVGVVVHPDGTVIDSIVMRRRLIGMTRGVERIINGKSYVISTGYSQGFFVNEPEVKEYCEYVASIVGAVGPLNIQCRKGKEGVYIFEVHPRFSGSASMRAEMGFNEPDAVIRNFLFNEKMKSIPHKLNYAVIRKFSNTVVSMQDYEKLKNTL